MRISSNLNLLARHENSVATRIQTLLQPIETRRLISGNSVPLRHRSCHLPVRLALGRDSTHACEVKMQKRMRFCIKPPRMSNDVIVK